MIITTKIVPLATTLQNNPNMNNNTLIDSGTKTQIVNYLLTVRELYDNTASKNKINEIINKMEEFTNKSNYYITNNL